ncbi:hypothetical protein C5167_004869 [Papaver somniferum]|uniref:Serine aminopeptidase S33 domain-containing protein n=1 Tax=Papaver somniferum TaxID=3469 RepID=A0A4Y7JD45_PAPSO|nr:hypothetical protein C5167_004869 [Papaver somniferum]
MVKKTDDGGPPRWFCPVECGKPIKGSPVLLFLPGKDGTGWGLVLHHKSLGKVFEVRCLHIPVNDRTPLEVGDSMGGCLALAVAARNPTIDLVLVLSNPATSFGKSVLQPCLPVLEALPDSFHINLTYLLSIIAGDPMKLAAVGVEKSLPLAQTLKQMLRNLMTLLPRISNLTDVLPKETLLWKLKLCKVAAEYANSHLHAINAEVLVLASGKDNILPSRDEARRLWTS